MIVITTSDTRVLLEAGVASAFSNQHILNLFGISTMSHNQYMLLFSVENFMSLELYLLKNMRKDVLTINDALQVGLNIAADIADGLAFLHQRLVTHGRLCTEVCFVSVTGDSSIVSEIPSVYKNTQPLVKLYCATLYGAVRETYPR